MARVIVMGGIGSGKSTVAGLLGHHGFFVIEADRIGHAVLEHDGPAHEAVAERWPEVMKDGVIDRSRLGQIVFNDLAQLRQLESMTHPHIRHRILELASTAEHVAVELPLLPEFLGPDWVSIFVDTPEPLRRSRLRDRGLSDEQISARMAAQPSRDRWLEAADHVVDNGGSLEQLASAVGDIVVTLTS